MTDPSTTPSDVYPSLTYADAPAAIAFLCQAFGFCERLRVPGPDGSVMHSELTLGTGVVMVSSPRSEQQRVAPTSGAGASSTLSVFVSDPEAHYAQAQAAGAEIMLELTQEEYGAKGYMARDPGGHVWYFADYRPGAWWDGQGEQPADS